MITAINTTPNTTFHGKIPVIKKGTPHKPAKTLAQNYDEFCASVETLGTQIKSHPLNVCDNIKLLGKTLSLGFQIHMKFRNF